MTATFGEQRSEVQKAFDREVMDRVQSGIRLLKAEFGESWVDRIDLASLNLKDGSACVLGQVYSHELTERDPEEVDGYEYGIDTLGIEGEDHAYGFSINWRDGGKYPHQQWDELQAAWEEAIQEVEDARS